MRNEIGEFNPIVVKVFRNFCHLDEGEITQEISQSKSPIFVELLVEIPHSSE